MATPQPDRAFWDRVLSAYTADELRRSGIYRDEQTGAAYSIRPDGKRSYYSPAAFYTVSAEESERDPSTRRNPYVPADDTGIFRMSPRWNTKTGQWETPIDWSNIANIGIGAGIGAAGLSAAGAFGGSTPLAATQTVPTSGTLPTGGVGLGAGTTAAGTAGGVLPSTQIGTGYLPAIAGGTGTGVSKWASQAKNAGKDVVKDQLSRRNGNDTEEDGGGSDLVDIIKKIALKAGLPIGAFLGTRALTGGGGDAPGPSAISPELQQLLAMSMRRMAAQEPLFEAVNRQALGGLPAYAKEGR